MTIDVVFRNEKGDELTWEEMDANLANLQVAIETKKDNFSILPVAQGGTGVATIAEAKQVLEVPEFANQIEYTPSYVDAIPRSQQETNDDFLSSIGFLSIQAAVDTGRDIYIPDGDYTTTSTIVVSTPWQRIKLSGGATITLDTATATNRVFSLTGAGASVSGGTLTTTLRTLGFLVNLSAADTVLDGVTLTFATKSTIAPIGGTDIPYNRGGVEVHGAGASVVNCNIYNQEGAGVVTYGDRQIIRNNKIHDNVLGIHASIESGETTERTVYIVGNKIYDNNVNHAEGADGILTVIYTNAIITGNEISGSGEHGAYVYSSRSTITGNFVHDNYRVGMKVKSVINTSMTGNICQDNSTEGAGTLGDIEVQIQTNNVSDILVANNVCHGANTRGIKTTYLSAGLTATNLIFDGNVCSSMYIAFSSDCVVSNNKVAGVLSIGDAQASAPATQSNALVSGNQCGTLTMGRCIASEFINNTMATLTAGTIAAAGNRIIGNKMTAQVTQIGRTSWDVFSGNQVNCSGLATTLLVQGSSVAINSFKQIIGNRFISHSARVIDDSSSAISGTKNVIANNIFDSATDGISLWGSGHTITGNININSGGTGFVGMNNSWAVANSPIVTLRAGTTGNVLL